LRLKVVIWVNSAAELRCVQWGFVAEGIGQRRVREKRQLAGTRMESKKKSSKWLLRTRWRDVQMEWGEGIRRKNGKKTKKKNSTKMGKMARNEKKAMIKRDQIEVVLFLKVGTQLLVPLHH
jgi:hypothetical protein